MGIRYRMAFTHSCRRSARPIRSSLLRSLGQVFLRGVPFLDLFFALLLFLLFYMPLTGKCYLLVFPEEGAPIE